MNIDATEMLVVTHMLFIKDKYSMVKPHEWDCVDEANDPMANFLCEQETKAMMWEMFGCSKCPDFDPKERW